ncbi:MAG: large subunit ribosomal protein L15 [Alteromonas naphthalenivorans]|jgi:large subunit ribosomal protein L15
MNKLHERIKITNKRKRIGRGGSRGGTSGKGHKGQKARSGAGRKIGPAFEGGQMPLHRRLPKRGFTNARFKKEFLLVNLDQLDTIFSDGDAITKNILAEKGLVKKSNVLVKILGRGKLSKKLTITVDACSAVAQEAIISCGGEVHLI